MSKEFTVDTKPIDSALGEAVISTANLEPSKTEIFTNVSKHNKMVNNGKIRFLTFGIYIKRWSIFPFFFIPLYKIFVEAQFLILSLLLERHKINARCTLG